MTEEERRDKFKDVSTGGLIIRIFVLLGKLIVTFFKHLLYLVLKGVIWLIEWCEDYIHSCVKFWMSNSTQEKIRTIKANTRRNITIFLKVCAFIWAFVKKYTILGAKLLWRYLCIGARQFIKYSIITAVGIWHFILWLVITLKDLIIHSKPTFIRLGKATKKGAIDFWHRLKQANRGRKLRRIRRKRAWQCFRREKGFKGLLIDIVNGITHGIRTFMEEEQIESNPEAVTEDDIIVQEIEDRKGKATKISGKIFKGVKNIVEEK